MAYLFLFCIGNHLQPFSVLCGLKWRNFLSPTMPCLLPFNCSKKMHSILLSDDCIISRAFDGFLCLSMSSLDSFRSHIKKSYCYGLISALFLGITRSEWPWKCPQGSPTDWVLPSLGSPVSRKHGSCPSCVPVCHGLAEHRQGSAHFQHLDQWVQERQTHYWKWICVNIVVKEGWINKKSLLAMAGSWGELSVEDWLKSHPGLNEWEMTSSW